MSVAVVADLMTRRRNLAQARSVSRKRSSRVQATKKDEGRFERENQQFFERVQRAYREIAQREPHRVAVIDARRAIGVVHRDIVKAVQERLGLGSRQS